MKARDFLGAYGITVGDAYSYVLRNINDPRGLFTVLKTLGVSSEILAEIIQSRHPQITVDHVNQFFALNGLDTKELDESYFNALRQRLTPQNHGVTNDNIKGTAANDYIDAGPGNDTVEGLAGDDILIGGSGNDHLDGGWGADYLEGGLGADRLVAGRLSEYRYTPGYYEGNRWVPSKSWTEYDLSTNILIGGGGDDSLEGGYGPDRLDGGDGADNLYGYEGNDTMFGAAGSDRLYGGDGADRIDGGDGDDYIYGNTVWSSANDEDTIYAGPGDDTIYVSNAADVDAGEGNDSISVTFNSQSKRSGVVKPGDGHDRISVSGMLSGQSLIVDLTETVRGRDRLSADTAYNHGLIAPVLIVQGMDKQYDQFDINAFNLVSGPNYAWSAGEYLYNNTLLKNHVQIITSPSENYKGPVSPARTPDDYGKGFFVIKNASATSDDVQTVAAFLDPYGNNHTYGKNYVHYFLINVGTSDMALYRFKDDSGADNRVVPDELVPIARFVGIRTDQLSMDDVLNIFV